METVTARELMKEAVSPRDCRARKCSVRKCTSDVAGGLLMISSFAITS